MAARCATRNTRLPASCQLPARQAAHHDERQARDNEHGDANMHQQNGVGEKCSGFRIQVQKRSNVRVFNAQPRQDVDFTRFHRVRIGCRGFMIVALRVQRAMHQQVRVMVA